MEAILKFDLPEDKNKYTMAYNGPRYWHTLYDMNRWFRNEIKYRGEEWEKHNGVVTLDRVWEQFLFILEEHGVRLEDVT